MTPEQVRPLGRTSLRIPVLGFGAAGIGNLFQAQTETAAGQTISSAWDAGIRYFDTAPYYGLGLSELRLGKALGGRPKEDYLISTKVGRLLEPLPEGAPRTEDRFFRETPPMFSVFDRSRDGVLRSFEASLKRLGLDRIDILLAHDLAPHNHSSAEDYEDGFRTFFDKGGHDAMVELRDQGVIGAIGFGVGDWRAAERLVHTGDFDVMMLAGRYTLLEQEPLRSLLPICTERGLSVIIAGPYNSGVLATGARAGARYNYRAADNAVLKRVEDIGVVCADFSVSLAAAALQFPLRHPAVVSVLPGPSSVDEVTFTINALAEHVPDALFEALKERGLIDPKSPTHCEKEQAPTK